MKFTRESIYRLIAGALGVDIKIFNPNLSLTEAYGADSLSMLDLILVIEEYTDYYVAIPDAVLNVLKTAKQYADYVLENADVN